MEQSISAAFDRIIEARQRDDYVQMEAHVRDALQLESDPYLHFLLACSLAPRGLTDGAIAALEACTRQGDIGSREIRSATELLALHGDPRFAACLEQADAALDRLRQQRPPMDDVWELPEVVAGQKLPMLVVLHGAGDNPRNFARAFSGWAQAQGFALLAICGETPILSQPDGYTWMDLDASGVRRLREHVEQRLSTGVIDPTRVYVLGLSQGSISGYPAALGSSDLFRGFISASGGMNDNVVSGETMSAAAGRLPVFILHSPQDQVIPFTFAQKTERTLRDAGFDVRFQAYDGGHVASRELYASALSEAISWMDDCHRSRAAKRSNAGS